MTQLTQEYLDKSLKNLPTKRDVEAIVDNKIKNLATREDLKNLATKNDVRDAVEDLARIVNSGFEEQQNCINKLDVRERVGKLEKDMGQIKVALHLKQ